MSAKRLLWFGLAVAALPALAPLWMILRCGVDCPYWDQWDSNLAGLYIRAADGQLTLWDFTAQHNEHRMFVPRTLSFALNMLTKWDTRGEMLLTWLVVCLTSAGVLWLIRQTSGKGSIGSKVLFLWFLCNLMIFSPRQQENWLWGIGLMNVMPAFFIISAMAVLHTSINPWVRTALAAILCTGAMFSSGNGVLAYPLVGIVLAWSNSKHELRQKRPFFAAWLGAFALSMGMFLWGYKLPPVAKDLESKVVTLGERAEYLLSFLGNHFYSLLELKWRRGSTLAGSITLCLLVTAAGCLASLWVRRKQVQLIAQTLPWCILVMFAVLSALIASVFRTNVGIENAISSRYTTVSLYQYVALIILTPLLCQELAQHVPEWRFKGWSWPMGTIWARLPMVLCTILLICYLHTIPQSIYNAQITYYGRMKSKAALLLINVLPENPKLATGVYPKVDELRARANRLNELGYIRPGLITSSDAATLRDESSGPVDLDRYGAFERLTQTGPNVVTAIGWAACPRRDCPVDTVVLTHLNDKNEQHIFGMTGDLNVRADLTRRFNDQAYELCGWTLSFEVGSLKSDATTVPLNAWVLDIERGKLRQLPGTMHIVTPAANR